MKAFLIIFLAPSFQPSEEFTAFVAKADGKEIAPRTWFCSLYGTPASVGEVLRAKAPGAGPFFVFDVADFRQSRA